MHQSEEWREVMRTMKSVAEESLRSERPRLTHVSIRVRDLEAAETLVTGVFGLEKMTRCPADSTSFPGEKRISFAWLGDVRFELIEQESPPTIGFDAGIGLPIGHLSEIGYFVRDLDAELVRLRELGWVVQYPIASRGQRNAKVDTDPPSGIPIELIELTPEFDEMLEEPSSTSSTS